MADQHSEAPRFAEPAVQQIVVDEPRRRFACTVDEMSAWSFPASDPPATWTWDVERDVVEP